MLARAGLAAALAAAALLVAAPASASPQFLAYEGRNAVRVGDGGEKKTVEGVDIWMNGAPPHRFEVIGSLTDHRFESGLYGMLRMSGLDREIADAARKAGGDAVILAGEGDDVIGVSGFDTTSLYGRGAYSSSFVAPMKTHNSRFVVVKYLTDDTAAPDGQPYSGLTPDGRPVPGPDTENLPTGAVARY
jgi:hypothetical protein